jgi:hypothetical protein
MRTWSAKTPWKTPNLQNSFILWWGWVALPKQSGS